MFVLNKHSVVWILRTSRTGNWCLLVVRLSTTPPDPSIPTELRGSMNRYLVTSRSTI